MAEFTDTEKQLMEPIAESRLRESLALVRNAVEDIWADDAPRIIQDYTDHGIHHSERLADYAAQLLAANDGRPLSAEETYLLLGGIYLHDIGMQCDVVKYPEIKVKAEAMGAKFDVEFTAKTASNYTIDEQKAIRKNHHLLTGAWIDHARRAGETVLGPAIQTMPDELVGDLIDVCKYHAKLPITGCPITFTLDERGRKQLVAALVRFADELDMDGHRVSIETAKNFRLDPRNAVYWWLHQLTKMNLAGNVITLTTRLRPDDEQHHGSLVREGFIEEFQTKNRPVLSVLRQNNIPIAISADSGVVPYEYADSLPGDILQALQLMRAKKGVLDELSEEVKTWLEAIGYEVSDPAREGRTQHMAATLQRGLMRQQVLVRCFEGEIAQADLEALEAEPSPQKWAISEMRVAPSAREYAEGQPSVQVFNLADFMRLIWGPYFDYLTALVEESDIPRYYVNLGCHRKEIDEEGREIARDTYPLIDDYIDDWLSERGKLHISLLGEFGTGKTWFCRHYAYRQLKCYLDDPIKERLPLLITLRAFTKAMTAQQLINDALLEQYKLPFVGSAFEIFQEMNRRGKLLLILDGFDEMARKVEYQMVVDNFWELAQVVVEGSKVLLTSRTEYFRWAKESEKVLGGEELGRRMIVIKPPKFEVLYLDPFSDERIEEVIVKRVGEDNGPAVARRILDTPNLAELARKPVLIELLLAVLPEIEARKEVNEAQVYLYATNELLLRNITAKRTFTTTADKLFFLCELAWEMIRSRELRIHYTDIPERIKAWFGDRIKDKPELDHWDYDLRNQTLLQRNAAGYYEFAHKSLAEYFVAYKFAAELDCLAPEFTQTYCEADGKPCDLPIAPKDVTELAGTFGAFSLSDKQIRAILDLLPGMVGDVERFWGVIDETRGKTFEDVHYTGGNAAMLLRRKGESFKGAELAGTVLAGAALWNTDLTVADLRGVNLREANLSACTLENTDLRQADLTDARIEEMGAVCSVAWSPGGRYLASGGSDINVRIWDTRTWEQIATLRRDSGRVHNICWSPDGKLLACASEGGIPVEVWEMRKWATLVKLDGKAGGAYSVCFSPGCVILASGQGDDCILIWDVRSAKLITKLTEFASYVCGVSIDPNGKYVAGASFDGTIKIWRLDTWEMVASIDASEGSCTRGNVQFSPDGKLILSGVYDLRLKAWEVPSGKKRPWQSQEAPKSLGCFTYSPDGRFVASASFHTPEGEAGRRPRIANSLEIWDCATGQPVCRIPVNLGWGGFRISYSPNGHYLASGSDDATIRIWDVDSDSPTFGECVKVLEVKMNCKGMQIGGAKGLDVETYTSIEGWKVSLRWWLKERGAVD